ncbi:tRNA lysidine(34) synthetase TilS [Terrihabitans sp. B22-R8]|uniref:tRNA lysidine(34) synthetase TilS n=1 Tax=Terrihabitans sp. B22-R8 TaxID=3425128 RepID=UPI00403D27F1
MTQDDVSAIRTEEAARLLAPLQDAEGVLIALSGGADSSALLALMSEWGREARRPRLLAAIVDHGLRAESRAEAEAAGALAGRCGVEHAILSWNGEKPVSGIERRAREARYSLLVKFAQIEGLSHMVTAHTADDQAETVLMRLAAGSGPSGLSGMRPAVLRDGIVHVRPLLNVPKARLVATLRERDIAWSEDAMNVDPRFARPRLRAARAVLEGEGLSLARLGALARRMGRVEQALDMQVDRLWSETASGEGDRLVFSGDAWCAAPAEITLRALIRAVRTIGGRQPRLERAERLADELRTGLERGVMARRTLAGVAVSVRHGVVVVAPAPPRRSLAGDAPGAAS